jgi:hypothetical protein
MSFGYGINQPCTRKWILMTWNATVLIRLPQPEAGLATDNARLRQSLRAACAAVASRVADLKLDRAARGVDQKRRRRQSADKESAPDTASDRQSGEAPKQPMGGSHDSEKPWTPNLCLVNVYRGPMESVAAHSDKLDGRPTTTPIQRKWNRNWISVSISAKTAVCPLSLTEHWHTLQTWAAA